MFQELWKFSERISSLNYSKTSSNKIVDAIKQAEFEKELIKIIERGKHSRSVAASMVSYIIEMRFKRFDDMLLSLYNKFHNIISSVSEDRAVLLIGESVKRKLAFVKDGGLANIPLFSKRANSRLSAKQHFDDNYKSIVDDIHEGMLQEHDPELFHALQESASNDRRPFNEYTNLQSREEYLLRCNHLVCSLLDIPPDRQNDLQLCAELLTFISLPNARKSLIFADKEPSLHNLTHNSLDNYKDSVDKSETAPKWGKRDKQKYKGYPSIFQFIVDYHSDIRTTGGLNERDHALYQAYRRAMKERDELLEAGRTPEPFPEGFKPLLDKNTEIATRARPSPEERRNARRILAEDERTRNHQSKRSR